MTTSSICPIRPPRTTPECPGRTGRPARLTDRQAELSEDIRAELDRKQALLLERLAEQPEIIVTWFCPDEEKDGGTYITTRGRLKKIDLSARRMVLTDGTEIALEEVADLQSELFQELF